MRKTSSAYVSGILIEQMAPTGEDYNEKIFLHVIEVLYVTIFD